MCFRLAEKLSFPFKKQQEVFELSIMKEWVCVFAKHVNENDVFTEPEG
jgi:hypothetical protein